ncbi:MAG: hypothetical protein IKQ78_00735 [Bacilli bacterium]|nr:hypothetical protein [Bacilli bacterium]
MEEESKIETVNQENKSSGLETAAFIAALASASINLFLAFLALCIGTNYLAFSIIEVIVYIAAFVLYVITAVQNKKVKFDLTLVLFAITTVMLFK